MSDTATPAAPAQAPVAPVDASPSPGKDPASVSAPPVSEAPKAPTPAEIRKMKLKVDGAEMELPEEEVLRLASQASGASKRFQEAAAVRKMAEEALELVKTNPREAFRRLGVKEADIRKFSEEFLVEALQKESEGPQAKAIREAQEKIREYEQREKDRETAALKKAAEEKQSAEQKAKDELTARWAKKYNDDIVSALDKGGIIKNAFTVKRMAQLIQVSNKKGINPDADMLAKIVREDYEKEYGEYTNIKNDKGQLDGAALIKLLGPEKTKAIQRAIVAQLKQKPQEFAKPAAQVDKPIPAGEKISWRDAQRRALRTGRN